MKKIVSKSCCTIKMHDSDHLDQVRPEKISWHINMYKFCKDPASLCTRRRGQLVSRPAANDTVSKSRPYRHHSAQRRRVLSRKHGQQYPADINMLGKMLARWRKRAWKCVRAYDISASVSLETRCALSGECAEDDDSLSDRVRGIETDPPFIL